ncbi:MAG: GCN5-related N-acetyltransferase, partial [Erythrobacter sp.]
MTKARKMLEAKWFELTRSMMPAIAKERDWPVRFDHCFQRILLDNACGGPWRDHIEAPAYANASDA